MSKKCKYYNTIHTPQFYTMGLCNYYNEDPDICYYYGDADRCDYDVGEYVGVLEKLQPIYMTAIKILQMLLYLLNQLKKL